MWNVSGIGQTLVCGFPAALTGASTHISQGRTDLKARGAAQRSRSLRQHTLSLRVDTHICIFAIQASCWDYS